MTNIPSPEEIAAPEVGAATVSIVIPCRAEYVAIARLAILGVANRLSFSYDEVEDVRLAVGEACSHAIDRAAALVGKVEPKITIDSRITPEGLSITVLDNVPVDADALVADNTESNPDGDFDLDKQDLGALLMEILVDTVSVEQDSSGTTVKLYKAAPNHATQDSK